MQPYHSKQTGSLLTALAMVFSMLGVPPLLARTGAQASANLTLNSLSTPITTITRVSVDSSGIQGNDKSLSPSVSADGRYVAFASVAGNLVSGDTNGLQDIFLRDTQTGTTKLVSVASNGVQGNGDSYDPSISADGRYVAFWSYASNLVSSDTNLMTDVFLRDTLMGNTTRVSVNSSGIQGDSSSLRPSISADGRYVAFESGASNLVNGDTDFMEDIFLHDTQTGITTRLSVNSSGMQGNGDSESPSISADGRYVAFTSLASNLVSGDTNGTYDIFLRDTHTSTTTLLSVDSSGVQGNDQSKSASISADGRYVAFYSYASNLVGGDTNLAWDVFLRDTQTEITRRLSLDSNGTQGNGFSYSPSISADGRYVAFWSYASNLVSGDTNDTQDTFLHDMRTGTTTRLSVDSNGAQGNGVSAYPSISADGRYVAFESDASNLVSGDTNGVRDVFVVPAATVFTLAVSTTGSGSGTVTSSPAGIACGFSCFASFNYYTSVTLTASATPGSTFTGWSGSGCLGTGTCTVTVTAAASVSANFTLGTVYTLSVSKADTGNGIITSSPAGITCGAACSSAFALDTTVNLTAMPASSSHFIGWSGSGCSGTGICTLTMSVARSVTACFTTTIALISVDSSEMQGNGASAFSSVSADGRFVAFDSIASNLVNGDTNGVSDVFLRDTQMGTTTRLSVDSNGEQGNGGSSDPSISADGRYVAFTSVASNLVSGDTNGTGDVFLRDTQTGTTTLLSVDSSGTQGGGDSSSASISADGRYVTFESSAWTLVSGDTNGQGDIFLRDTQTGTTTRLSVDSSGIEANGWSYNPAISADGRYVAFSSAASNLVSGDTNGVWDIFLRDTQTGTTTRLSVNSSGIQGNDGSGYMGVGSPSLSADGRYVAFHSLASNLVNGDTNNVSDIFLRDTQAGTTTRLSVDSSGTEGNSPSYNPSISADGRYVVFDSEANNLVSGDTTGFDTFLRDTHTDTTIRLSVNSSGVQGNGLSLRPSISADGRYVAFESRASNLVNGDANNAQDVFVVPVMVFTNQIYLPLVIR